MVRPPQKFSTEVLYNKSRMDGKVWVIPLRIWELLEHLRRWNKGWWFCSLLQNSLTLCYTLKEDFSRPIETSQAQVIIKVTLMNRTSQLTRSSEMNIAPLIKQSSLIHIFLDKWSSRVWDYSIIYVAFNAVFVKSSWAMGQVEQTWEYEIISFIARTAILTMKVCTLIPIWNFIIHQNVCL